jgi:hypothetical protein
MGRTALNIRHKAYSAGIMLVFRPVKSLGNALVSPFFMFTHDDSLGYTYLHPDLFRFPARSPKFLFLYGNEILCKPVE